MCRGTPVQAGGAQSCDRQLCPPGPDGQNSVARPQHAQYRIARAQHAQYRIYYITIVYNIEQLTSVVSINASRLDTTAVW